MVPRAQTCVRQVEMMDRMCAFRGAVPEIERNWLAFESLSEKNSQGTPDQILNYGRRHSTEGAKDSPSHKIIEPRRWKRSSRNKRHLEEANSTCKIIGTEHETDLSEQVNISCQKKSQKQSCVVFLMIIRWLVNWNRMLSSFFYLEKYSNSQRYPPRLHFSRWNIY